MYCGLFRAQREPGSLRAKASVAQNLDHAIEQVRRLHADCANRTVYEDALGLCKKSVDSAENITESYLVRATCSENPFSMIVACKRLYPG
jgi:hypothetical protein